MSSALERLRKARQGSETSLASPTITSGSGGSALARLRAARKNAAQTSITTPTASNTSTTGTSALARLRAARKAKLTPEAQIYASDEEKMRNSQTSEEKDVGGLLGGIGYVGEKIGLGFLQGVEGVVDYAVGGLAELFGADDFSEDVIANDWLDYNHADSWYKPSEGWKLVGDVGGGIGTSLPGLAAGAAVTYFTGGTGLATGIGLAVSGFSVAGTSTKEAYLESGELTGKQYGYGARMGVIEAVTETLTGALGTGLTKAVSSVSSALGKAASKTAASLTVKGVAKQLGKEFVSEAFEEGVAEFLSPVMKRLTYNKDAELATADEIAYAALIGGLSGVVMGGVGMGTRSVRHIASGNKVSQNGKIAQTLELGQMYADVEADEATGSASIQAISEIMGKIGNVKDGDTLTVNQKRLLGELAEYTTVAPLENIMRRSAITAVNGAEAIAQKLASDGNVKLVDGKLTAVTPSDIEALTSEGKEVRDITAEDITKGYDSAKPETILKALQDNEILRYVSASDAAGRLILSGEQVEQAALTGTKIRNQVDLNKFIEETNKDPERRAALGKELGIADNEWDTLQLGRFNEAIAEYRKSGKADAYKEKAATVEKAKAIPETEAKKKIPSVIALGDGKIQRYKTDKVDIAVSRDGSSFIVYDYNTGDTSRSLTRKEVNAVLAEMKAAGEVNIPADGSNTAENAENSVLKNQNKGNVGVSGEKSTKDKIAEVRERLDAKKIDEYLAENVKDYSDLGEANRSMIRKIVREGRAHGIDDADVLSYARVAARSGLNIEFDANMKDGEAGYFDPDKNRIVVNPKTTKKQELILIHELDHAIRAYIGNDGKIHYLTYKDAEKKVSKETRDMIKKEYADQDVDVSREELFADEASAYYIESILGGKGFLDLLLGNEPNLQQKITTFFTDAAQSYSGDPNLAKSARAHYRNFKKMFADFAARNKGRNAQTAVERSATAEKSVRRASNNIAPQITAGMSEDERRIGVAVADFIEAVNAMIDVSKQTKRKKRIGLISKNHISAINSLMKTINPEFDATGYELWIDGTGARHIEIRHGKNGKADKTMASKEAKELIPWAAQNAEKGEFIKDKSGEISRSDRFFNSDGSRAPEIRLEKSTSDGTVYISECVPDSTNKRIWITSAYINKNGSKGQLLNIEDTSSPQPTPEASFDSNATTVSIPQTAEKSTDLAKKSSETSKSQRKSTDFEATLADESPIESIGGRDAKAGAKRASRFSQRRTDMTVGQIRQMIARYTGDKVYSSKEARETIDEIYGVFSLSGKNRAKLYEAMWQGYNACRTDKERVEFSADMAEYVTVMLLSESSVENSDKPGMLETISKLKRGIGHLVFDDIEKTDLQHALDKDGWRRFYSRWGFRETAYEDRRRYPLDEFITDLARENEEYSYLKDMTPQDAILELDSIYQQTVDAAKQTVGAFDELSESEITEMIGDIGTAIYESFGTKGEKSTAKKVIEAKIASAERKYSDLKQKYEDLYQRFYEHQELPLKLLRLSYQIRKMKDLQLGTFLNSTDYRNDIFKETFNILGSIEFRGVIIPGKVREAMQNLSEWYKPDNPVLKEIPDSPGSMLYSDYIALMINELATGKGKLSMRELGMLDNVLRHATHIVENFNRVWKNGKWVNALDTAKDFVKVAHTTTRLRSSADMRKLSRMFDSLKNSYLTAFGDPMTVFRYMDGYQDGFFSWAGEELRAGAFRHGVDVMEMKTEYDKFLEKDHKGYLKNASKETVEYGGAQMSKLQYISLYMTMQRAQAQRGLAFHGFSLIDVNGRRVEGDGFIFRVQKRIAAEIGIDKSVDHIWELTDEQIKIAAEAEAEAMKKKLSAEDLQFIGIIESTLNGKCKELKTARDMERLGYSNTISGYYYPIVRAMIAKTIDSSGMWGELDRASRISANKNTVKRAEQALWIESVDTVFNRHIDAVARYAELSPAIDAINKIFNLDVSGNKNKPKSVRSETFNTWQINKLLGGTPSDAQKHNGEAYLKDLLADLQGIGKDRGVGAKLVESIRGGFAISSLAANPKVLLTQLSSLFASTNILPYKSLASGMWLGFKQGAGDDVDKYCPIAKLRNYDVSAAKAQGVLDNVRGVGEVLMKGVSFMDRGVVRMLWGACQAEIESTKKLKIGTEENMTEAGKLLERVLQETQQGSVATEKSAAMRSTSWLARSITMFTSDAMKGAGRFIDSHGREASLNARIKMAEESGDKKQAEALRVELEKAKKEARKSFGALLTTALYMTLIARAFSWLYAKDDEEENPALAFIADVFGGMIGGLPGFSDVYDFATNGYEISDSVYDSLNDVLSAVRSIFTTAIKWNEGEATGADFTGSAINVVQTVCTSAGIPFRNVRNTLMGLSRRFLPNAAYRLEMLTESKNYERDFEEAIDAGDEDKAYMILEMLLSERLTREGDRASFDNSVYLAEAFRMDKAGYNIKPRTIGDSVMIGDEEVDMTPEEQAALRARYSEAVGDIETLIGSAGYASLTDEQKSKAVRFVYDSYYDVGIYELYGYERNMKRRIFSKAIPADKLALAYAATAGIEADYTDGGAVSGSRRKKVIAAINRLPLTTAEKLLIIAYKGYSFKDGDVRGISAERAKKLLISYLLKLNITKDDKAELAEACGFEVKNGRISLK